MEYHVHVCTSKNIFEAQFVNLCSTRMKTQGIKVSSVMHKFPVGYTLIGTTSLLKSGIYLSTGATTLESGS